MKRSNSSAAKRRTDKGEKEPRFNLAQARQFGGTTQAKLEGLSDEELKSHVKAVEETGEKARELLGYWRRKLESAEKEKEAFEGVIENLVKHARKVRQ